MAVLTDPFGWFTMDVPEGWSVTTEDCVSTLRSARGLGTVFVSGGRHAGGRQQNFGGADFLCRFLRSLGIRVTPADITSSQGPGCRIYMYESLKESVLWRYWSVTDDETALLISYTRRDPQSPEEMADVDHLVRSVRLFHSAPVH
jgi:hypothetical protein